ncbi:MAG: S41 family peptidase [Candidatus Kapabacteria bacterium]|jgi:hypothetical protein|nr:S41 family peptidase [Candidatus Kapabacteria bacterium]
MKSTQSPKALQILASRNIAALIAVLGFSISTLFSQAPKQDSTCACEREFSVMTAKIEENYVGYFLTKDSIEAAYTARKRDFSARAQKTPLHDCTQLLQHFLRVFGDEHLFVVEYPKYSPQELAAFNAERNAKKLSAESLAHSTNSRLEGYWTDGTATYKIVPHSGTISLQERTKARLYEFVAVIVDAPDKTKIGEVKFAVSASQGKENLWEGTYWRNDYTPRYMGVSAYKDGALLSIWGGITWTRRSDDDFINKTPLTPPDEPTVSRINAETMLLTIPSFLIEKSRLDNVLQKNIEALKTASYLIIDIRGNTGGNGIYYDLLSAYYEKPAPAPRGWALASADNIAYFSKFTTFLGTDPYSPVVQAMKSANDRKSALVQGPAFLALTRNPIPTMLKKVVILTDRGNKSAAETFILHSKAVSSKVLIMGENTGGVVDYNNVNMIPLRCAEQGIMLGYPMYTLHESIPKNGYNGVGIAPDVRIDAAVKDKISFVTEYLQHKKE